MTDQTTEALTGLLRRAAALCRDSADVMRPGVGEALAVPLEKAADFCNGVERTHGRLTDLARRNVADQVAVARALLGVEAPSVASQPGTCGRTRCVGGAGYPPCVRRPGHAEAYCRSGAGDLFLAAIPGALARVTDHAPTGPVSACDTARFGETCGRPAVEHQLHDGGAQR